MVTPRNFSAEREQARAEAEQLTSRLQAHGYDVSEIDWERAGRLAYVFVDGVNVGDLLTLSGSSERGRLLEDVRYRLLEAAAQQQLHSQESAASWTPLDLPEGAPTEIQGLWRIHLGEDDAQPGVNIAEVVRDGKRRYEYYPGGPTPGVHTFYVDTITPCALQLIRAAGGTVTYHPHAQRADDEHGRRQVNLPEGTRQVSESEENMAPQRFLLPQGEVLRLVPHWYTVELSALDEHKGKGERTR
jgi:hypothetical protein